LIASRSISPPASRLELLPPPVDFNLYQPTAPDAALRAELGLRPDEKILVFTGSNTFANEPEMRELYLAVALLNQRGTPTRLIRTGFTSPTFLASLAFDYKAYVLDLGFVTKTKLPSSSPSPTSWRSPARPGPFNHFRLPSKLPSLLASGKPIALPPTTLALLMQDGREAVFLKTGSPEEIADTCQRLFADPKLCAALWPRRRRLLPGAPASTPPGNTQTLAAFYNATVTRPTRRRPGPPPAIPSPRRPRSSPPASKLNFPPPPPSSSPAVSNSSSVSSNSPSTPARAPHRPPLRRATGRRRRRAPSRRSRRAPSPQLRTRLPRCADPRLTNMEMARAATQSHAVDHLEAAARRAADPTPPIS